MAPLRYSYWVQYTAEVEVNDKVNSWISKCHKVQLL